MKIAIFDPSLFTLTHDHHLCDALTRRGHEVVLFGRRERKGERRLGGNYEFRSDFFSWTEPLKPGAGRGMKVLKGLQYPFDLRRHLRELETEKFDIVHFQWLTLPLFDFQGLKRLSIPKVLTVHDFRPFMGAESSILQTVGSKGMVNVFNGFLVHTDHAREGLEACGVSADRISRTQTADVVDLGRETGEACRKEILLFGAMKAYKGADLLIQAFARIPREIRKEWTLRLVGQVHPSSGDLVGLAIRSGVADSVEFDFRFVDEDEIPEIARRSMIHAYPYREIDQSAVFSSFLKFGRAVIATNVGHFAEVLRDGENAVVVPSGNIEALTRGLERLIVDEKLRGSLGEAALSLQTSLPSWSQVAQDHERFYERMVGGKCH